MPTGASHPPLSQPNQKVAVVTGANRRIGREVARQLAERGWTVVLTARDAAKARRAAQEIPGSVQPAIPDVASQATVDRFAG